MQYIEVPETLAMPVRRFVHPGTGGQVTFVGVLHIAQPGFFERVCALLEELREDHADVFAELITGAPDGMPVTGAPSRRPQGAGRVRHQGRVAVLCKMYGVMFELGAGLGLADGREHLEGRPGWQSPDLSLAQRAALMDKRELRRLKMVGDGLWALRSYPRVQQKRMLVRELAARVAQFADPAADASPAGSLLARAEAARREAVMVELDRRCAARASCHVALAWGTEHLPGFDRLLAERGYRVEGEDQWLTAIDVPSFLAQGTPTS